MIVVAHCLALKSRLILSRRDSLALLFIETGGILCVCVFVLLWLCVWLWKRVRSMFSRYDCVHFGVGFSTSVSRSFIHTLHFSVLLSFYPSSIYTYNCTSCTSSMAIRWLFTFCHRVNLFWLCAMCSVSCSSRQRATLTFTQFLASIE